MARLVFLGRLADLAGRSETTVSPGALGQVVLRLEPELTAALTAILADPQVRIALNGTVVAVAPSYLAKGDELAFLPPVSGG